LARVRFIQFLLAAGMPVNACRAIMSDPEYFMNDHIGETIRVRFNDRGENLDYLDKLEEWNRNKPNPDAHLGAEEKPYRPLVVFQHHSMNCHSNGRGQK
jgi:hypothetical protein